MSSLPKVSVCIANYKSDPFCQEALDSIEKQSYKNIETCVYHDDIGIGTGQAFNEAIKLATGDIVFLLCSDDVLTDVHVISDVADAFKNREVGHVSRWYYQFVNGDPSPVRAWRGKDVIELANNPSGMAFRKSVLALEDGLTNRMFVEVAQLVHDVLKNGWDYTILDYDTIAVRIHKSISRTPGYYKKMWNSSPVLEWNKLGWKTTDFTHLIQVAVNFEKKAVWSEIRNFIKIKPICLVYPSFWFYSLVSLLVPRKVLHRLPEIYRKTVGKWTTKVVKRNP